MQSKVANALFVVDTIIGQSMKEQVFPGAAVWIARHGQTIKCSAYGRTADRAYDAYHVASVHTDTIYDLASLTKVIATTAAILHLSERGFCQLDDPVSMYIPQFGSTLAKASVKIWHFLTHTSGLPAHVRLYEHAWGKSHIIEAACRQDLLFQPGVQRLYTDLGFLLLGAVVRIVSSLELDEYVRTHLFEPLGMKDTMFNPPAELHERVAPTEYVPWRGGLVCGQVHDEDAWAMGGVAGHAGLFSTVEDLAKFCTMLFGCGRYQQVKVLEAATVIEMLSPWHITPGHVCGLGWVINDRSFMGRLADNNTIGHTGFTGTSIVIKPQEGLAIVLLANRVCPTRNGPHIGVCRQQVANALADIL